MKKILLLATAVAMATGAMNAGTIKVLYEGEEIQSGSTVTVKNLDVTHTEFIEPDYSFIYDQYEMNAHLAFVNTSSNAIKLGGNRQTIQAPEADTWGSLWCIGQNCVAGEVINPQPMEPGEKFEGSKAHVYMSLGSVSEEDGEVIGEKPSFGSAEYKYTLYVDGAEDDNFVFNIRFIYDENSDVYVNGELVSVENIKTVENAVPVYYNMQGVRISNPEQGKMYIVRRGQKVSKEIVR